MPNSVLYTEANYQTDVNALMKKQDELEKELIQLKEMYKDMKERNNLTIGRIHERIDRLEKELADLRETLNELKASIKHVQSDVTDVKKHVSQINAKQDIAIQAQDKFISQLWKAFFTLLGLVTMAGGAIFTLLK